MRGSQICFDLVPSGRNHPNPHRETYQPQATPKPQRATGVHFSRVFFFLLSWTSVRQLNLTARVRTRHDWYEVK